MLHVIVLVRGVDMKKMIVALFAATALLSVLAQFDDSSALELGGLNRVCAKKSSTGGTVASVLLVQAGSRAAFGSTAALCPACPRSFGASVMPVACRKNAATCSSHAQCCSGRCEEIFGTYVCIGG